jgi:paired amphipathic helix protein Sin3a
VKSILKNQQVFDNFLRCLVLYNEEVLSRQEVVNIVTPFFSKAPELLSWFKDFCMKPREDETVTGYEPLSQHLIRHDQITEEQALEIGEFLLNGSVYYCCNCG